jgi:hydrogenase expression/formation protein HypC
MGQTETQVWRRYRNRGSVRLREAVGARWVNRGSGVVPVKVEEKTMCLGIPGKVTNTYREHDVLMGKVDFGGVSKHVCLEHVPLVEIGDYVIVHVGFALSRIDEAEAKQVFAFLDGMNELAELGAGETHEVPG